MSAWDITGAAVWPIMTVLFGAVTVVGERHARSGESFDAVTPTFATIASFGASVFCIARLCGAYA